MGEHTEVESTKKCLNNIGDQCVCAALLNCEYVPMNIRLAAVKCVSSGFLLILRHMHKRLAFTFCYITKSLYNRAPLFVVWVYVSLLLTYF